MIRVLKTNQAVVSLHSALQLKAQHRVVKFALTKASFLKGCFLKGSILFSTSAPLIMG